MTAPQLHSDAPPAREGQSGPQRSHPRITVPSRPLIDEPAGIVISGCAPGRSVTVTASSLIDGFAHLGDGGTGGQPVPLELGGDQAVGGFGPQPGGDRPGRRGSVGHRPGRRG